MKYYGQVVLTVLALFGCFLSCKKQEAPGISPLGITARETSEDLLYDLEQIQDAGELIAGTLSGPDTYYEYKGKGFGLQFELAEHFAVSIGAKLRMEIMHDTTELFRKLELGEIDLIAMEMTPGNLPDAGLVLSGLQTHSGDSTGSYERGWVVRSSSPLLSEALQQWYKPEIRNFLQERGRKTTATGGVKRKVRAPMQNRGKGIISPYDSHFKRHSQAIGWDWRLMAAQCYQESGFDPQAVSWAGACGLMQIMPETAAHLDLPMNQIYLPEKNIAAAARYIRELEHKFRDVTGRAERINFVLAAYNGGSGHIRDAMALARKHGKNPQVWNEVSPFILKLSQPQYYNDPVVRYGYLRGEETYGYVKAIHERWRYYRSAIHGMGAGSPGSAKTRNGFKSRVLSAEELEAKSKEEQNHP